MGWYSALAHGNAPVRSTTSCQLSFNIRSTYLQLEQSLFTEVFSTVNNLRRLDTVEKPSVAQSPVVAICNTSLTFTNSTFCPTQCIYVFYVDLRTNSDFFPIQH